MRRRPPRSTRTYPHFPYTTLFRSVADRADFRALCAANARLLAKSGLISILCAGSVVPTGRTRMDDDDFTPRLGRMRSRGKEARYIGLVIKAARRAGKRSGRGGRFDGSRIGRGASVARVLRGQGRHASLRSRRVIVKFRPVTLAGKGLGGAKAHLSYIQRDGVTDRKSTRLNSSH